MGSLCLARGHSSGCLRSSGAGGLPGPSPAPPSAPCTLCLLERQLGALLRGPRGASVSPGEVVRNLHLFSKSFVRGRQEDSHEFLTALLDVTERDARRAAGSAKGCRTLVEDLFQGRWQSQVRCLGCGHESNTYESFVTLPLDILQARTVLDGLRAFTEAERLDGANKYRCDRCRQLVAAVKQTTIWDDPNVLVVHLKRFDAGCLGKVTRHVAFPEVVDLGPFLTPRGGATGGAGCAGGAVQNGAGGVVVGRSRSAVDLSHTHTQRANGIDGEGGSQHHHHPGPHPSHSHDGSRPHPHAQHASPSGSGPGAASSPSSPPQPPSRSLYTLTGVLVHQGASLHGGHYYALVRDSQDRWHCMNDSSVCPTSLEQVRQEQAYMLFYTRGTMKAPRTPPDPQPAPAPTPSPAASAAAPRPHVYGPQLPPHLARASVGADAPDAAAGPARPAAGPRLVGLQLPSGPARSAQVTPTARLPAKVPAAPAVAANGRGAEHAQTARPQPGKPGAGPQVSQPQQQPQQARGEAPAAAAGMEVDEQVPVRTGAGPAEADSTPHSAGQKRKRGEEEEEEEEHQAQGGAAAGEPGGKGSGSRGARSRAALRDELEAEARAHKACRTWSDGVKRLKLSLRNRLHDSEWLGRAQEAVRAMQAAGLSLPEVLEGRGRDDPRFKSLRRDVPRGVLSYGMQELGAMLRSLLALAVGLGLGLY